MPDTRPSRTERPVNRPSARRSTARRRRRSTAALFAFGVLAALVVAGIVLVGPATTAAARKSPVAPQPAMTVTVQAVRPVELDAFVEASGSVAAWQEASVGARLSGLPLILVAADVGDEVHKDQILARFDDASLRADLAQAEALLEQAQASARQAEANRERAFGLKNSGAISDLDILQYKTQADTTKAQASVARASLDSARLKLASTRVLAPDDGVISARSATLGAVAQAGSELFKLIRQSRLEWRAELNPTQVSQVHPGLSVQLTLPDGSLATGRVRQLAPALDGNTRLGLAYIDIDAGSRARASMYASGRIQTGRRDGLAVPGEAVVIRDGRSFVFLVDPDQRVRQTPVTTGRFHGSTVEVLAGLTGGQEVVVRGAGFLNDKDLVRVVQPQDRAEPAAPASAVQKG